MNKKKNFENFEQKSKLQKVIYYFPRFWEAIDYSVFPFLVWHVILKEDSDIFQKHILVLKNYKSSLAVIIFYLKRKVEDTFQEKKKVLINIWLKITWLQFFH